MDPLLFENLLEEAAKIHGHLCPGQVLGVKMSLLGLREIGITDPKGKDRKNLMVFVEMDRCATDAIQSVTGTSLGKRTMKFWDYGKMAATFLNLQTGKAIRVIAREDIRKRAAAFLPDEPDKYRAQLEFYRQLPLEELFYLKKVRVEVKPEDMPGRPQRRVPCGKCGEYVQDGREIISGTQTLCRPCAGGGYFQPEND